MNKYSAAVNKVILAMCKTWRKTFPQVAKHWFEISKIFKEKGKYSFIVGIVDVLGKLQLSHLDKYKIDNSVFKTK